MAIVPDEKDWTWVVEQTCPECGFAAAAVNRREVGERLRANSLLWRGLLEHPAARRRPHDGQWSALEYACHVRDVFRVYDGRLARFLAEDDPMFQNWDQDATAVADCYDGQDPATVVDEVEAAGAVLADRFAEVPDDAWGRRAGRSDGARFTLDTFARYLLHDPVHHVWDVDQGYRRLASG
jgi:hypothetical protein